MDAPLKDITVVDFSQFLAGPYATLKLLDMGARVIKVENPNGGDLCRKLYLSDTQIDGDSTLFHAINRGKESIALDLKTPKGLDAARRLVSIADVVIQNFRPGVIDRLGLDFEAVRKINPDVIYGSISGYGVDGEWSNSPGQDLLAQARSGIMWLSGNSDQGPVPLGLPIADISAGANLAQGVLGALYRLARTGEGAHVETSLLGALIDLQFEFLTTFLNNGNVPPQRMASGSAHGYLAAPYGVYETADGYLALAMTPLETLATALALPALSEFTHDRNAAFQKKNQIQKVLSDHFMTGASELWEKELGSKGIWCAKVLTWKEMMQKDLPDVLGMIANEYNHPASAPRFVGTPVRMDGARQNPGVQGPELDANGQSIEMEFNLF